MDVRAYLHRDGSVIMQVSLEDLQNPQALYQEVGIYCHLLDSQYMHYAIVLVCVTINKSRTISGTLQTVQKYESLYILGSTCFQLRERVSNSSGFRFRVYH